ncbi:MAG: hypothetical protein Q4G69_10250 [Planctomycetia bacterium]|nr:hypothetical protein [Planctomycetia bacterium]
MKKNGIFMIRTNLVNTLRRNFFKNCLRCSLFFTLAFLLGAIPVSAQESDDPMNDEEQLAMLALDKDLFCDVRLGEEYKTVEERFTVLKKEDDFSTGAKILYLEPLSKEYKEIKITFVAEKCAVIEAIFTNFKLDFSDRQFRILEVKFGPPIEDGDQDGFHYYKFTGKKYNKDIDVLYQNDNAETNPTMKISFRFR